MVTRPHVLSVLVISVFTLAACGGGGGSAPVIQAVTVLSPSTIYSKRATPMHVLGVGLPEAGPMRVVLRAESGTPFMGGTSQTLEVPAHSPTTAIVDCALPATGVAESFMAFVSVIGEDGAVIESTTPLLRVVSQSITGITPSTIDGSSSVPVSVSGAGFMATASTSATIRFEATGGAKFHVGTTTRTTLTYGAHIESDTEVTANTQYMGVISATPCRVIVTLSDGTVFELPGGGPVVTVEPGTSGVQGTWTYERVRTTTSGLDYGSITEEPIREAKVQLVRDPGGSIITERTLDAAGAYLIHYGIQEDVIVRVLSETGAGAPPIRVEDNTNGEALYAAEGAPFLIGAGIQTHDYVATTGWGGSGYTGARAAAPFAIMDSVYEAMAAFLAVRSVPFPRCVLNWSVNNRPSAGYDVTTGQIGGAHYLDEIYLAGKEDVDTDEFDLYVITHEWGHYFEDVLSRSDSLGGAHNFGGDWLDPTVSFGEGLATAVAAAVLAPDTIYRDSMGVSQATGWGEDVEDNTLDGGPFYPNRGWFSETSVMWLLLDIMDSNNEGPHDTLALGLGPVYDAFVGPYKTSPYATTIFSFLDALKVANPSAAAGIDTLCAMHGIDAVADGMGTGETNDGGYAANLPVYHSASIGGGSVLSELWNAVPYNWVDSNRRFTFVGNGSGVTVDLLTPLPVVFLDDFDIALTVYRNGVEVGYANYWYTQGEVLTLSSTVAGDTYVVLVTDVSPGVAAFSYWIDLLITSP